MQTENPNYKLSIDDTEHIVNRIIRDIDKSKDVKYVVYWYRCGPANDTVELLQNILQHFKTRYLKILTKIGNLFPSHLKLL